MNIVLGSSSPYRKELLDKLNLSFTVDSPDVDETPKPRETAEELVARLSKAKARAVARRHKNTLVIGSDQVAVFAGTIMGKPHTYADTVNRLEKFAGNMVSFHTGLCLINSATGNIQLETVPFKVYFRRLSRAEITSYVTRERPFNCAGGFQADGLGIALLDKLAGDDPSTLIGLPLIKLIKMLKNENYNVLTGL